MSHVFGPVPSRRLGHSLGVDVVPFKTCTYDCIYCQLGRTTCKTIERKEWVPLEDVLIDVEAQLGKHPDYITLSGSGEPTLYSRLRELVTGIRNITDVPLALLTNGSLLWQQEVRDAIQDVDLIIPSLDAGDEAIFRLVNRPHDAISFDRLIEGLEAARAACHSAYWLEVFLIAGYTDTEAEVKKIARYANSIRPDRIQINTVTRPPAESFAGVVSRKRLEELAGHFSPQGEVIADYHQIHEETRFSVNRDEILDLLQRRPCAVDGIAQGLGMHPNEVVKYVEQLQVEKLVETTWTDGICYYRIVDRDRYADRYERSRDERRKTE